METTSAIDTGELSKDDIEILTNVMPELKTKPKNMPDPRQVEEWQKTLVGARFIKVNPKGENIGGKFRFLPDNLWPEHDIVKDTIKYRIHVIVSKGRKLDHLKREYEDVMKGPDGEIFDFHMDVDKFVKDYKPHTG